ncbi:Helicase associated domain protein [Micromonospora sp. NPDC049081]|uniref:DEAD/DEAH box helicase n=1 Tax=Micromonospora sp. NPDC049081 TaxID=3155150 RepID=UPI0033F2064A
MRLADDTTPTEASHHYPQRRPHQTRALSHLAAIYQRTDRAQVYWACGTGKTLLGRWLHDDSQSRLTLVLVPSLALTAQALTEWQTGSPHQFAGLVVCSDQTAGDPWRIDRGWWSNHGIKVTTDHYDVAAFLRAPASQPKVVFSTYHSAQVVADAARRAGVRFDLAVCDEAHRLAGHPDDRFRVALDGHQLPARRRLFVTATPVHTSTRHADDTHVSMSDKALFGPVADTINLADAIAAGLLVDYRVLVIDGQAGGGRLEGGTAAAAALVAAAQEGLSRVISYHSRVARAHRFAATIHGLPLPDGRTVHACAVAGVDSTASRRAALTTLTTPDPGTVAVVTNARCLAEGVNVPAVDGVIFAEPRTSDVDIVQAVGRALRPSPGKTRGLIILPVTVPVGASDHDELLDSEFATVWAVLRALRSLDPRMAAELDQLRTWNTPAVGHPYSGSHTPRLLRCDLTGVDLSTLAARVADDTTEDESWTVMLPQLTAWAATHGHTVVPWAARARGQNLGRWVHIQRRAYATGLLSTTQAARLEAIPGWAWTVDGAWWISDHTAVTAAARQQHLDLNNPAIAGMLLPHRSQKHALTVGRWCAQQRRAHRDGDLPEWHTSMCEQIPGWTWNAGVPEREQRMVDALAEWVEAHADANVPADGMWGRLPLGQFITAVRRRNAVDRLTLPLRDDILLVTPGRASPGSLDWQVADTRFALHVDALRQYAARTGGCDIPENGTENLSGWTANIGDWAARQRHLHRRRKLTRDRVALLESVPGWMWERPRTVQVDASKGVRQHGTRLGYAAGCTCGPCVAVAGTRINMVDASPARGHLRLLEGRIGFRARTAVQALTGLNKKTIDEISNEQRTRVTSDVDQAVRALTVQAVRDHIAAHPSGRDMLPSAPTIALIDDLAGRGWPRAWIARELGKNTAGLQIARPGKPVRRETAEQVAALHAAVGGRVPPPRRQRTSLPTLAEIIADEVGSGKTLRAVAA